MFEVCRAYFGYKYCMIILSSYIECCPPELETPISYEPQRTLPDGITFSSSSPQSQKWTSSVRQTLQTIEETLEPVSPNANESSQLTLGATGARAISTTSLEEGLPELQPNSEHELDTLSEELSYASAHSSPSGSVKFLSPDAPGFGGYQPMKETFV